MDSPCPSPLNQLPRPGEATELEDISGPESERQPISDDELSRLLHQRMQVWCSLGATIQRPRQRCLSHQHCAHVAFPSLRRSMKTTRTLPAAAPAEPLQCNSKRSSRAAAHTSSEHTLASQKACKPPLVARAAAMSAAKTQADEVLSARSLSTSNRLHFRAWCASGKHNNRVSSKSVARARASNDGLTVATRSTSRASSRCWSTSSNRAARLCSS